MGVEDASDEDERNSIWEIWQAAQTPEQLYRQDLDREQRAEAAEARVRALQDKERAIRLGVESAKKTWSIICARYYESYPSFWL